MSGHPMEVARQALFDAAAREGPLLGDVLRRIADELPERGPSPPLPRNVTRLPVRTVAGGR